MLEERAVSPANELHMAFPRLHGLSARLALVWTTVSSAQNKLSEIKMNPIKLGACAIYTRKLFLRKRLEQDFNSLTAARACEAFIKSQASEGWRLVNLRTTTAVFGRNDGTTAVHLARLIDVVVASRLTGLTRSLADFAKMVRCSTRTSSFIVTAIRYNN